VPQLPRSTGRTLVPANSYFAGGPAWIRCGPRGGGGSGRPTASGPWSARAAEMS